MSAIELRALRKRYPPREPGGAPQDLWRGLELTVGEGEFVAIEGQSGTGKSTLLHVVGGLDRAYEGEVLVLGERLRGLSDREVDGRVRDRDQVPVRLDDLRVAAGPAELGLGEEERLVETMSLLGVLDHVHRAVVHRLVDRVVELVTNDEVDNRRSDDDGEGDCGRRQEHEPGPEAHGSRKV